MVPIPCWIKKLQENTFKRLWYILHRRQRSKNKPFSLGTRVVTFLHLFLWKNLPEFEEFVGPHVCHSVLESFCLCFHLKGIALTVLKLEWTSLHRKIHYLAGAPWRLPCHPVFSFQGQLAYSSVFSVKSFRETSKDLIVIELLLFGHKRQQKESLIITVKATFLVCLKKRLFEPFVLFPCFCCGDLLLSKLVAKWFQRAGSCFFVFLVVQFFFCL